MHVATQIIHASVIHLYSIATFIAIVAAGAQQGHNQLQETWIEIIVSYLYLS